MSYANLLEVIDKEFDNLNGLEEKDQVNYLIENFDADPVLAHRSLTEYGLIGDE